MNHVVSFSEKLGYSLAECELLTSLSRPTLNRAIHSGDLGSIKVGRRRVVPRQDLLDYIERKRAQADEVDVA